jgi:uncharacterized ferritin-like protein (DUF455 family)
MPGFGYYYNDLKKKKGSKTAAVATARKLLAVVWRLLKDNRPYEATPPHVSAKIAMLADSRKSGSLAPILSSI